MAAAQRQPRDARGRDDSGGNREPVFAGRVVYIALGAARLDAYCAGGRIDLDAFHRRKVDDETIVAAAEPRAVMAAAANREQDAALPREIHRRHNLVHI